MIDFKSSAIRHFDDAGFLEADKREANAGQLYGFCAECGIKALLIALGYPTDADGSPIGRKALKNHPDKPPYIREHIDVLVAIKIEIENCASGRSGAKYLALIPSIDSFSDWSTDYRYFDQHKIPPSLPAWKGAAAEIMKMMDEAFIDGVLR